MTGPFLHGNLVRPTIFPWKNSPPGPKFHGKMVPRTKIFRTIFPVTRPLSPEHVCCSLTKLSMNPLFSSGGPQWQVSLIIPAHQQETKLNNECDLHLLCMCNVCANTQCSYTVSLLESNAWTLGNGHHHQK